MDSLGKRNAVFDRNRRKLRELEKKNQTSIQRETNRDPIDPSSLKIGDRVKLLTIGQNGEIISLPDDKGNVQVQVGIMKVGAKVDELMLIDNKKPKKKPKRSTYGSIYKQKAQTVSTSIDVRGKNLDDAVIDVEKYIDDAFISGLDSVTIIHGRGEGILRKGIHEALRRNKSVKSYQRGSFDEGGDGVTVAKLKR